MGGDRPRMKRALAVAMALLAAAALLAASLAGADEGGDATVLVSRAGLKGKGGDGNSFDPSISADGRYVAFASRAGNLGPGVKAGRLQVYVRDMKTGRVTLVSRASGPSGAVAAYGAGEPSISADGRYVAFASSAENLSSEDGTETDVFVRDLAEGTTTLVSRAPGVGADGSSSEPSISADGRKVAFTSSARNLGFAVPPEPSQNVYVRDLDSGGTELVSRAASSTGAPGEFSSEPSISADGRYVAFSSRSPLAADDVDQEHLEEDVFVRDRVAMTTALVSRATGPAGAPSDVVSDEPAISADGRYVAFTSDANLAGPRNHDPNVFLRDLVASTTWLVTVGEGEGMGSFDRRPSISADGRYVAFQSGGDRISPVDAKGRTDVFVRDMQKGLTVTISRGSGTLGLPGDGPSFNPSISADGSVVAFDSLADNFSDVDEARFSDVFLRRPTYAKEPRLPECHGKVATIIGTKGADVLEGTKRQDVIIGLGGADRISTYLGGDLICAGAGRDTVDAGGSGENGGTDIVFGEAGADHIKLGPELGTAKGGPGNDVLIGSKGGDNLYGGAGNDLIRAGKNPYYNTDFLYGGPGDDRLYGGPSDNEIKGGPGDDVEVNDRE